MIEHISQTMALELLLFAATLFCIVGAEDFAFDLLWVVKKVRSFRDRQCLPSMEFMPDLAARFAIFVPAWDEATVIGSMIARAKHSYRHHEFVIFMGIYPNDQATLEALQVYEGNDLAITINAKTGPTSKGDALNTAWSGMLAHEQSSGASFDYIVLHDAEDVICSREPDVFALFGQSHDFMQLPVVPIPVAHSRWVAGHYCDEFAEAHLKSLVTRGQFKGSIPSAGVGTAIKRSLIGRIAHIRGGLPFSPDSLTEDYELGLIASAEGHSAAFLRVEDPECGGNIVCVRSRFPESISAAVRQKARWVAGIAFAGWDRMGWSANPWEAWMRWRDRRAMFEASALVAGYGGILIATPAMLIDWHGFTTAFGESGQFLFWSASFFMLWRLAVRVLCTNQLYGWREGLRALPRVVVSNVIAVSATVRAARIYWRIRKSGRVIWDKTSHDFTIGEIA
jgi:bacteriophage N4 adsorption protein B